MAGFCFCFLCFVGCDGGDAFVVVVAALIIF